MNKLKKYFGSSILVAAFIDPGTLTTCTMAGVNSAYDLLWAMLFAMLVTRGFASKNNLYSSIE